jgi:uncharacterized protein
MHTYRSSEGQGCIIVFMRAPRLGRVKTRLSRHLEGSLVLDLYRMFILDTLETVATSESEILVFLDPPTASADVAKWLGSRFSYAGQEGPNLGARMGNAFSYAFSKGFPYAVLIGSDTPDLPLTILEASLNQLRRKDAVIGPSTDGGYYLIGFSGGRFLPQVFASTSWGTDRVFSDAADVLTRSGYDFHVLPEWSDIDRLQDVTRFLEAEPGGVPYGRRTRTWIIHHRETIEEALARAHGQSML